jgi:hypothetical protein
LHVSCSSSTLDVPRLVVVSGSDGLGLLVEVPDLSLSSVWSLDDHISVVDQIDVSSTWQSRDDVEISLNKQSKLLVKLSLLWLRVLVNIHNLPLLSKVVTSISNLDVSVFSVSVKILVLNLKDLSFFVHNESSLSSEELPPS